MKDDSPWNRYRPRPVLHVGRLVFLISAIVAVVALSLSSTATESNAGGALARMRQTWPWALLGLAALFYAAVSGLFPHVPWRETPPGRSVARAVTILALALTSAFALYSFYILSFAS